MQIGKLQYDGPLDIATGLSVTSRKWKNTEISWHDLLERLSEPVRTGETYAQFMAATKDEQGKIKDVGGFVAGHLVNGRRDKGSVLNRSLVTLDIDFSHQGLWPDFTMLFDCAAAIHSTHKSSPSKPRHRLLIPLDRPVGQEEYQAVARRLAGYLGIDLFDQSTFDVNRLMFWPSVSKDMDYYFEYQDGPFLQADQVLATYVDWRDTGEWPMAADMDERILRDMKKQEDPEEKKGIVGAFCRTYDIAGAVAAFLPDVYTEAGPGRYTYAKGSTTGGLVLYGGGKFAYSHHGTDPAGGRLCNAFDLVRIHRFGHLDSQDSADGKKSFRAMEELAQEDPGVRERIARERLASAKDDFRGAGAPVPEEPPEERDISWTQDLQVNGKGEFLSTAGNLNIIFRKDAALGGAFRLNAFDNKRYLMKDLPWHTLTDGPEPVNDTDYAGVRNYLECAYGIVSSQKIDDALALEFEKNKFHPIQDYLKGLVWDGRKRVDTLLIDYFGAEDNLYTRAAIRKTLLAAVTRVFRPGAKFDLVLVLSGDQGTYKSTFISRLGKGWTSDTFTTVQGKEAFEQLQGVWLVEMAELSGLRKADAEPIKNFLSKCADTYRPAYGRTVVTYRRQCVFFGTTNNRDFLNDPTGNRRFNPVDVRPAYVKKNVWRELTDAEVDQIWAEAYQLYLSGEELDLSGEEAALAEGAQDRHSQKDERQGLIHEFLDRPLPPDWDSLDLYERRSWIDNPLSKKGRAPRMEVCVAEIWCELFGKDKADLGGRASRELNNIMRGLKDWEPAPAAKKFGFYGKQRYYRRKEELL